MRSKLAALVTVATMLVAAAPAFAHGSRLDLRFRGQAIVPTGTTFEGTTVGGLSSITYDSKRGVFYAVSDDASSTPSQPVRYYTVGLDVRDGRLADGDVRFKDVTTLLAPGGQPYAPFSLDPEGLALTKDRELIFTSEGIANSLIDPFIRRYSLDGCVPGRAAGPAGVPGHRRSVQRRPPEPGVRERRHAAAATSSSAPRTRSSRTARPRPCRAAAPPGSCATTCGAAGSSASGSTTPTPSRSRRCRRPSSRSTGSWSCCRSTTTT